MFCAYFLFNKEISLTRLTNLNIVILSYEKLTDMKLGKEKEIEVVTLMIEKYCHGVHKTRKGELCKECLELLEYVKYRRSLCPWKENKPFCSNCKIHCYKKDMQTKIREVMRYSGPRMLLDHPLIAISHVLETKREKKKVKKKGKVI